MPKTDPDGHREASETPPPGESASEASSRGSRPAEKERLELVDDAKRFKENHEKSFRLLSREGASHEGASREDSSGKNTTSEDQ